MSGTWSIGELAERAGVTVKTVRFYSDRGLLPEAVRSAGGHRRYGLEALDRLRLIRALRTLDLPVPEVGRVLAEEDALEDVIAGRLRQVGSQLAALRWREAALQLLRDCPAEERADRLRLVGAMTTPPSTDAPARFWRRLLPARLPARLVSAIVEAAVPQPPADPTPAQVLAFARLHALTSRARFDSDQCRPEDRHVGERPAVLYDGLGEAYALASADLRARRPPYQGEALDCFVAAHAHSRGTRDTPAFRRQLGVRLARSADPLISRYWELAAELSGPPEPTMGAAHDWLRTALDAQSASSAR
ncbi:MerR family transcriptional regulator [Kitasatospora sp. NPDC052896]|uniref:helix-turn-helix domain-containing protein n=1 Tax=Kitasatospora sp. NPDC052896 TaxID=3364061 RepID=UPI0037CB1D4A